LPPEDGGATYFQLSMLLLMTVPAQKHIQHTSVTNTSHVLIVFKEQGSSLLSSLVYRLLPYVISILVG
jgi:hypothetical protein